MKSNLIHVLQKEEKIRILRQRVVERDTTTKGTSGQAQITETQTALASLAITQGKESLVVIQPDHTTTSDFDSAIGGGMSFYTRSSHASQSDFEFSESYL